MSLRYRLRGELARQTRKERNVMQTNDNVVTFVRLIGDGGRSSVSCFGKKSEEKNTYDRYSRKFELDRVYVSP